MRWFTFASAPIGRGKAKGKYQTPSILNANEKVNKLSERNNQNRIDCGGNNSKILFERLSLSQETSSLNNVALNGGSIK